MSGPRGLRPLHFRLYRLLLATAWRGNGGRPVCSYGQGKLAARLGVTPRTVQALIADLREPGLDPRHPEVKPSGLRLGWLLVLPREHPGGRGGKLYGANQYVLQLDPAQLDEREQAYLSSSDRSEASYPQEEAPGARFPRSDRSEAPAPESNRSEAPNEPVSPGQIEAKREPTSLSHFSQGGSDTHPESNDRAPLRSAASGSAARSAAQEPARNDDGKVPVPVDWRAALGRVFPPDTGERYASREEEEAAKRERARLLLLTDPDPPNPEPCRDCPEAAAG